MTFNMKMIEEHIPEYKEIYRKQFGEYPKSWFSALNWLSSGSPAQSFTSREIIRTKEIMGVI